MPSTRALVGSAILFVCLSSGINVDAYIVGRPGFRGEGWGFDRRLAVAEGLGAPVGPVPILPGGEFGRGRFRRVEAETDNALDADNVEEENSAELDEVQQPISIAPAPTTQTPSTETDDLVHRKKKIPENAVDALTLHERAVDHLVKKLAANPTDETLKSKLQLIKASAVKFEEKVKEMITQVAQHVSSLSATDSESVSEPINPRRTTSHALHTINKAIKCLQHMDDHGEGDKTELHETMQKAEDTKTALENHLAEHGDIHLHQHVANIINGGVSKQTIAEIDAALDSTTASTPIVPTTPSSSTKPHHDHGFKLHMTPEQRLTKLQDRLAEQTKKLDLEKDDPSKLAATQATIDKCQKRITALEDHIAKKKAKEESKTPGTVVTPVETKTSEAEIDDAADADAATDADPLMEDAGGDGMGPGPMGPPAGPSGRVKVPLWSRPAAQRLKILTKRLDKMTALQNSGAPEAPGAAPGTRARRIANAQKALMRTQHLISIGQTGPLPPPGSHMHKQSPMAPTSGPMVIPMQPAPVEAEVDDAVDAEAEVDDAVTSDPASFAPTPSPSVTPVHAHVQRLSPEEIASMPAVDRLAYWQRICDSAVNVHVKSRCQQRIIHTQQLIKEGKTGPIKTKSLSSHPSAPTPTPAQAMDALDMDNETELDDATEPENQLIFDPQSNELHHDHEDTEHESMPVHQQQIPHFTEEQLNSVLPAHVHVSVQVDMEQEKPKHHHALKKIQEIMGN